MKRVLSLLLLCLALAGCGRANAPLETTTAPTETLPPVRSLYAPDSAIEQATQGALRAYPLDLGTVTGIRSFGGGLLVFSGEETTTLYLLRGEELAVSAAIPLGIPLTARDPSLQLFENALSYTDPAARETILLDDAFQVLRRIVLPDDLTGTALLSSDQSVLYYCTEKTVRAWDLESGIRRTLKEMAYPEQQVTGLLMEDTILRCTAGETSFFLNVENGQLISQFEGTMEITSRENRWFAALSHGLMTAMVFGEKEADQILLPAQLTASCRFFPESNALLATGTGPSLELYDLSTGFRSSMLSLAGTHPIRDTAVLGADVYLLMYDDQFGCDTLFRWDTAKTAVNDGICYAGPYNGSDTTALSQCESYAQALSDAYGITIAIGPEAAAAAPWDYTLEPETSPAILLRELENLEKQLSQFPEGFWAKTAAPFSSLTLSLVRQVSGAAGAESLKAATGVQFLEGTDAHAVIAVGPYAQQAMYHELFHIMETTIFNESIAFDQWDKLNPAGFRYDYDYAANAIRDSGIYLKGDTRAFVDTYSMSFPKEDRARIFEYAMLPNCETLFEAPAMQAKLRAVCEGIREAWDLEKHPESFPWEQYLEEPLH